LVSDLHIDRNTGSLYVNGVEQLYPCMRLLIHRPVRRQCQV
jgi:hypothetical protein